MRTIGVFNNVTIDGFFCGSEGDIEWAKNGMSDPEWQAFNKSLMAEGGALMFGRTTYEIMANFWPTPMAEQVDPLTTAKLRESEKIVFSSSLAPVANSPTWKHVSVHKEISAEAIRALKESGEGSITILGSGTIVRQLTNLGLIDEYSLVTHPLVLGTGKSMFAGVDQKRMALVESRSFANGLVWSKYRPAK